MDELHGLAAHPDRSEYCTVGDDCTVRVWESRTKGMIRTTTLDTPLRCCCYHPDGKRIAVGMGGNVGRGKHKKTGTFVVMNAGTLEVLHEGKDSKQWITDIRYSPDGNTLGVASFDDQLYVTGARCGHETR